MTHLIPSTSPGRVTRKARKYAADIARLRLLGYTLDAIRQALADAGVQVSICTVWREAKRVDARAVAAPQAVRLPSQSHLAGQQTLASATARAPPQAASPVDAAPPALSQCSGKDLAEAFVNMQITNPFFRRKG
ncbi:MAG TPA: hypothetical protein VGE47_00015 [Burkholderiaceae bacterium]